MWIILFFVESKGLDVSHDSESLYAVLCGLLVGAAVCLFTAFVVLPLSRLDRHFSMSFFLGQLVINMLCVGLPIALVVKHFS